MKKIIKKYQTILAVFILPPPPSQCGDWSCAELGDVIRVIDYLIANIIAPVGGGIIIIFIAWGAILYLTAYGNEERAQKGKSTLVWAIIGLSVILLARVLVGELNRFLTGQTNIPSPNP